MIYNQKLNFDICEIDGVIIFKNKNTTIGFIRFNDKGEEVLSFGKYRDVTLAQIWKDNPGYFSWINQADFPLYTKNVMRNFATKMKLQK